jgi:UrcA family protein
MRKRSVIIIAVAAAFSVAAGAHAEHRVSVLHQTLAYSPEQAATPDGARRLVARIDGAALTMCRGRMTSFWDRPHRADIATCRSKAVARAVAELNAPAVTAAYAEDQDRRVAAR